ncbi:MAG: hypothetical protein ACAI25_08765, partial [Planctomycetota bacterium]
MQRPSRSRGSALIAIVVIVLIMMALASVYVGTSTTITFGNRSAENRLQARFVAYSGLNRALACLDGAAGDLAVCSHSTTSSEACFGNVDGNISNSRVWSAANPPVANRSTAIRIATGTPFNTDSYVLDTGASGTDGWPDFKGQIIGLTDSNGARTIPLNPIDTDGAYTVRCQPVGVSQGGVYGVYHLRTYGVWKGEVFGYDCYAQRVVVNPFDFAAFGDLNVSASGNMTTQSYKSGYPPDAGDTYVGPPVQYADPNPNTGQGDVGSNGTITTNGGSLSINGVKTEYAAADLPPPSAPPPSGPNYGNVNGGGAVNLGSAGAPISGSVQVGNVNISGNGSLNIYPQSGQTLNVFVTGDTIKVAGQAAIAIKQPATGDPGIVKIWLIPSVTSIDIAGQGVVNTDANSAPAAAQLLSASTAEFKYTGGSGLFGVIYAPGSTVSIGGGTVVTGSVIAKQIDINGSAEFHYDLSLRNLRIGAIVIYKISSLVEVVART